VERIYSRRHGGGGRKSVARWSKNTREVLGRAQKEPRRRSERFVKRRRRMRPVGAVFGVTRAERECEGKAVFLGKNRKRGKKRGG